MRYRTLLLAAMLGVAAFAQSVPYANCAEVQRAIGGLPDVGGVVNVAPGTIVCHAPLVIDRPNVTLKGAGPTTIFRLADRINQPVIVIGSIAPRPSTVVRGVIVRDIAIDANGDKQTQECDQPNCPFGSLRANGLTIRSAEDIRIENVNIRNARSGGLVTEFGCRRIRVSGLKSEANVLDGIALYETEDSSFGPMQLLSNGASGISADIRFRKNNFHDVVIRSSGTVGVFLRDSSGNLFSNLHVELSKEHGIFLAQVDADTNTPATNNVFHGLRLESNAGAGIRVNDVTCTDNVVSSAILIHNTAGCISEVRDGLTKTTAVVCR